MGCTDAELSLLLTGDSEIRELNLSYRGKDKPTDVLSFPSVKSLRKRREANGVLGDVVISVETARRQAKQFGVTLREEILRLLVHGVLHLVGYEHDKVSPRTALAMRRKEAELLEFLVDSGRVLS